MRRRKPPTISSSRLPAGAAGWPDAHRLSITVVADLHAGGPNMGLERVRQVVDAAHALDSDLIVILGDYFATHRFVTERVPHPAWAAELGAAQGAARRLLPSSAITTGGTTSTACARPWPRCTSRSWKTTPCCWTIAAAASGWPGSATSSRTGSGPAASDGVDDLPGTLARITTDDPVILLAHEPDIFTQVPPRVALTLAGHTHGGQIVLPFMPPLWTPSEYGARFAYGHIVEQGRHMIVSGGLGCSKVPLRLGVPPEIVRVTLGA